MGGCVPAARLKQRAGQFIQQHLRLQALPFRPDIAIYMPTPQSGLVGWLASEDRDDTPPYWAYAWGGGAALALYLRDHPETVKDKTVLDFGAGSGLVGIAAARAGARKVWAVERDQIGQVALDLNARANAVDITLVASKDLPDVDIVLAGDIFYAPDVVAGSLPVLQAAQNAGAAVLVGDPFRRDLPLETLDLVAEYAVADMGGSTPVRSAVFTLRAGHDGNAR